MGNLIAFRKQKYKWFEHIWKAGGRIIKQVLKEIIIDKIPIIGRFKKVPRQDGGTLSK